MSNGPNARVGEIMEVDLPRPRSRKDLLAHPDYYRYRQQLLDFLEHHETAGSAGAKPAASKAA
jgi:nitrate/nitrite transport system ATP-binding protein